MQKVSSPKICRELLQRPPEIRVNQSLTFLRPQQSILRTREFPVAAFNRVNFFFHCIY